MILHERAAYVGRDAACCVSTRKVIEEAEEPDLRLWNRDSGWALGLFPPDWLASFPTRVPADRLGELASNLVLRPLLRSSHRD